MPTARRKKGSKNVSVGLPFPNYALGKTELPVICRCTFDGHSFYVQGVDMHTLYYNVRLIAECSDAEYILQIRN